MKDNKSIEESNLDEMLNGLFIEENSFEVDENSARFVMEQEYDVKIDATKEKKLLRRLNGKLNGFGGYSNFLIVIVSIVIVGVGILFFNKYSTSSSNSNSMEHLYNTGKNENAANSNEVTTSLAIPTIASTKIKDSTSQPLKTPSISAKSSVKPSFDFSLNNAATSSWKEIKSGSWPFIPTEQDFIFYNKVKNKMLEKLLSIDKAIYTAVEEGKIQYRNNTVIIDPFIMRNQAITNLEYKVFLADLIKKDRQEDYKKAMVHNEQWINYNDNNLAANYFKDEKYNDFPVVNISREGALLFCSWIEKEVNLFSQSKNPKAKPLKIRLPFDSEWIFATTRGYTHLPDCNGYKTIFDIREGIVDINFIRRIELIRKRDKRKVTALDQLFSTNRYRMEEDKTLQLFEKGFVYKGKPIVDSLYPNRMDVFSKAAHVSEIIQEKGTSKTVIIGSCWKDKEEYSEMVNEFNKESVSPFVGFRLVIINDNKATYKHPFW